MGEKILVGVSTCLLGEAVRWDGGQRRAPYMTDILGRHVELVPVCPESELGMGIPREPIHLEGDVAHPRLLGNTSRTDWTDRMTRWSRRKLRELAPLGLAGYVLKRRSPSCGMARVPVERDGGGRSRQAGSGLFAAALMRCMPLLPVEEEGRLDDPALRENFIVRVFAYHRLRQLCSGRASRGAVVAAHMRQRALLLAHSPRHLAKLDRLVAEAKDLSPAAFRDSYIAGSMDALRVRSTTRKNVRVLQRLMTRLRGRLDDTARDSLAAAVDRYGAGLVPLIVPLTLVNHQLEIHGVEEVVDRDYRYPAPAELALRNHV